MLSPRFLFKVIYCYNNRSKAYIKLLILVYLFVDAIKFPDLIHTAKPEPDREVPQGGTSHCTAYDFFSQHTESAHTVMWALSGRGLVKSFRQVEGFGVHT